MKTRAKRTAVSPSNDVNEKLTSKLEANRTKSNRLKPNLRLALRAKDRNTDAIGLKRCSVRLHRMNMEAIITETKKEKAPNINKLSTGQTGSSRDKENGNIYEYSSFTESTAESNNGNKNDMNEYFRKLHAEKKIILKRHKRIGTAKENKPPSKAGAPKKRAKPTNPVKVTVTKPSALSALSNVNALNGEIEKAPLKEAINVPFENGGKSQNNSFRLRECAIKLHDVSADKSKQPENVSKAATKDKTKIVSKEKENMPQQKTTSQIKDDQQIQICLNRRLTVRLSRKLPDLDNNESTTTEPPLPLPAKTPDTNATKKVSVSLTKMDFNGVTKRKKPAQPVDQSTPVVKKTRTADKIAQNTLRPPSIHSFINDISSVYDNPVPSTSKDADRSSFAVSFTDGKSPIKQPVRSVPAVHIAIDDSEHETSIDTSDLNSDQEGWIIDCDMDQPVATPSKSSNPRILVTSAIVHRKLDENIENIENQPADISRLSNLHRSGYIDDNIISPFSESFPAKKRDYGRSPLKSITNNCHSIRSNASSSIYSPHPIPYRTMVTSSPIQHQLSSSNPNSSVRLSTPNIRTFNLNAEQNPYHLDPSIRQNYDNVVKELNTKTLTSISIPPTPAPSNAASSKDSLFGFDCTSDSESEIERQNAIERIKRDALAEKKSALKNIHKEVEKCPLISNSVLTKKSPKKKTDKKMVANKEKPHHTVKQTNETSNIFGQNKDTQKDIRAVFEAKSAKNAASAGASKETVNVRDPSPLIFRDIEPEHHRRSYSGPRQYRKRPPSPSDDTDDETDDEELDNRRKKKKKKQPIKRKKLIDTHDRQDEEELDRFANKLNAEFAEVDTYDVPTVRG